MSVPVSALEIFRARGIPNRRQEDWKYTDLRGLLDVAAIESAGSAAAEFVMPVGIEQSIFERRSGPSWAKRALRETVVSGTMDAAARAYAENSVALRVPAAAKIAGPLKLDLSAHGHYHVVLVLERDASLTMVETHSAVGHGLCNVLLSVYLAEGARLTHVKQASFSKDLVSVETISIVQEQGSHYRAHILNGGAKLSRTEWNIELAGEGAEAELGGISVLGDDAHADITTRIVHAMPNTTSRQLFKKVAGGHSRAVYQGKIAVREGAIGSDSRQTAKALLLSARAEADLKPELEIFADDVKCAHGAAVGDLDQDSLFYLRSRGIPEDEARGLLIHAFLQDVVDGIADESIRNSASEFVERGLAWAMVGAP